MDIQGIIRTTHLIGKWFLRYGYKDDPKTESTIDSQATWVTNVLGFISDMLSNIHGCLYNQALEEVWSTGA